MAHASTTPRRPPPAAEKSSADPNRFRCDGKFFRRGTDKFWVKGVTYGPFPPNADGDCLPAPPQAGRDLKQIRALGANCVRVYHVPPRWFLDLAAAFDLCLFVDLPWASNLSVATPAARGRAVEAVAEGAARCAGHRAIFALCVANELPSDLVRLAGRPVVERFIDDLIAAARAAAPGCLVTFANFPPTEYLNPRSADFVCFNVYLHDGRALGNYLARLHHLSGERPLLIGEYGVDVDREGLTTDQPQLLRSQLTVAFDEGAAGMFVFSFADEWSARGEPVEDWSFGLTTRQFDEHGFRVAKPAFAAVAERFGALPTVPDAMWPTVAVVVCSHNGGRTLGACLASLARLRYPRFETIVVDDGSDDDTAAVAARFPGVRLLRTPHEGLSAARNTGFSATDAEIVAYTDDDCEVDEDWLARLVATLRRGGHAAAGGPNLVPPGDGPVAACVGLSPGGPAAVLLDDRLAEHVPGCNMAFRAGALRAAGGFDPQFRAAGDDVDLIWRLADLGHTVGYAPTAQVWHHRRATVAAYLRQQWGYGRAEALLARKHPHRFGMLGAGRWGGRIYAGGNSPVWPAIDRVHYGPRGQAMFQQIYRGPVPVIAVLPGGAGWHGAAVALALCGFFWRPLFAFASGLEAASVALALAGGFRVTAGGGFPTSLRLLVASLHFRQPIARGWARRWERFRQADRQSATRDAPAATSSPTVGRWRREIAVSRVPTRGASTLCFHCVSRFWLAVTSRGSTRARDLKSPAWDAVARWQIPKVRPAGPSLPRKATGGVTLRYWSKCHDRARLLDALGCGGAAADAWAPWDLTWAAGPWASVSLTTATERHAEGQLTLVSLQLRPTWPAAIAACLSAGVGVVSLLIRGVWGWAGIVLLGLGWLLALSLARRAVRAAARAVDAAARDAGYECLSGEDGADSTDRQAPSVAASPVSSGDQPVGPSAATDVAGV